MISNITYMGRRSTERYHSVEERTNGSVKHWIESTMLRCAKIMCAGKKRRGCKRLKGTETILAHYIQGWWLRYAQQIQSQRGRGEWIDCQERKVDFPVLAHLSGALLLSAFSEQGVWTSHKAACTFLGTEFPKSNRVIRSDWGTWWWRVSRRLESEIENLQQPRTHKLVTSFYDSHFLVLASSWNSSTWGGTTREWSIQETKFVKWRKEKEWILILRTSSSFLHLR